jgi:hypothetical protein
MFELSLLGLAGIVLGSAAAGGFIGIRLYRRWHEDEIVDLDAIHAEILVNLQRNALKDPRISA